METKTETGTSMDSSITDSEKTVETPLATLMASLDLNQVTHGSVIRFGRLIQTEMRYLPVESIFTDFDRNHRDPNLDYGPCHPTKGYDHEKYLAGDMVQGFFESIFYNGIKKPIVTAILDPVIAAALSEKLGHKITDRTMQGHRRMFSLGLVNKFHPGTITHVPAIRYIGLTEQEEMEILSDHGGADAEEKLSEIGEYRACLKLYAVGFSQTACGQKLGFDKGWAMRRLWIHEMGTNTPIEVEFLKRFDPQLKKGTDYIYFPYSDVEKLHKAWGADAELGNDPMGDDATFKPLWLKILGGKKTKPTEKAKTREEIKSRAAFVAGCGPLEAVLNYAANEPGADIQEAASQFKAIAAKAEKVDALSTDLDMLTTENGQLKADIARWEESVKTLQTDIEALNAAIAANMETIATLTTENAELKATKGSKPRGK